MKSLCVTLMIVGLSASAFAQTSTLKIAWIQPDAISSAAGFTYALVVDGGTSQPLQASCVAAASQSSCSAAMPQLTSGTHTLVVTASNAFGSASSDPLGVGAPGKPINVTVTVVVQVP